MLALQNAPAAELSLSGVTSRPEPLMAQVAKFDLMLSLVERRGPGGEPLGIEGGLEYSLDLFDEGTASAFGVRLARLLAAAVESPDLPLHPLEVLDSGERRLLLEGFNSTARPVPGATLPELFEAQVALTPGAVALSFEGQELSYGELNARANGLAHHLIGLGVGPECLVGVCLERSVEMVVALLGILKAGGAYLPLDPEYPEARLARMLADAVPLLVLSTARLGGRLPEGAVVLEMDAPGLRPCLLRRQTYDPTDGERTSPLWARHPAYVIYTSGSTGTPKGVIMPQTTMVNLMAWHGLVAATGRVAQFTSISFDVSLQEILHALLSGKTLVVIDSETRLQPERFVAYLKEMVVTELFIPNIVLEHLAKAALEGEARPIHSQEYLPSWRGTDGHAYTAKFL